MTPTPISPPAGGGVVPSVNPNGQPYIGSGICSGTAFTHNQTMSIYGQVTTKNDLDGAWLPGTTSTSGIKFSVYVYAVGDLHDFSTSAGVSGCANMANMRQMQEFVLSSTSNSTANIFGGGNFIVTTASSGEFRRWARGSDSEYQGHYAYGNAWFPTDQFPTGWNTNPDICLNVLRGLIQQILAGGVLYSNNATAPPGNSPAMPEMKYNLMSI
mgnify:CR=1 FL=1